MSSSIKKLMNEYFDTARSEPQFLDIQPQVINEHTVPITPFVSTWIVVTDPNRLMKTFKFSDKQALKNFVWELLSYQEDHGHHAKIVIQESEVIIETYTHDVNDVTELDQEYAHTADMIYDDLAYMDLSSPGTEGF